MVPSNKVFGDYYEMKAILIRAIDNQYLIYIQYLFCLYTSSRSNLILLNRQKLIPLNGMSN